MGQLTNCHIRIPWIDSSEYCVIVYQHSFVGELLVLDRGKGSTYGVGEFSPVMIKFSVVDPTDKLDIVSNREPVYRRMNLHS
jgi:hypothetical protein